MYVLIVENVVAVTATIILRINGLVSEMRLIPSLPLREYKSTQLCQTASYGTNHATLKPSANYIALKWAALMCAAGRHSPSRGGGHID